MNLLSYFSTNFALRFHLPVATMLVVVLFYLLGDRSVKEKLGQRWATRCRKALMVVLAIIGVLAVENYRATDYHRFDSYLNAYEFYHYYIGTKYAHEVGYTDMYAASLIADSETGMKWRHTSGTIRDLNTGRQVNHRHFLEKAEEYKAKFTPERWEEFKKDIVWFKGRLVQSRWNSVLRDKGYNGTPVWTMLVGGLLSNRISTDSEWGMMFLALLDPILILAAFLIVAWAFGPRTALLMIVLLGTHYMMKWWHMKGAYLRTDWAMCLVMSAAFIKKQRFATAGVLTGYAALSRIFPAVLLFGIGAKLFWNVIPLVGAHVRKLYGRLEIKGRPFEVRFVFFLLVGLSLVLLVWRTQALLYGVVIPWLAAESSEDTSRVWYFFELLFSHARGYDPVLQVAALVAWLGFGAYFGLVALWGLWHNLVERKYVYFMIAFLLTTGTLMGISHVYWRGTDYWSDYSTKISKHSEDISTWRVGYKYVFMADFGEDFSYIEKPLKDWQPRVRSQWYRERQEEWWRTQIWILILTLIACVGIKDYRAYLLGFVPLFFLVAPTYYYYIMLLVPLLFFAPRIERARYALGLCLMYLTGMSGFWFYDMWKQDYATYYWLSFQIMIMVFYMLFLAFTENEKFFKELKGAAAASSETDNAPDPETDIKAVETA